MTNFGKEFDRASIYWFTWTLAIAGVLNDKQRQRLLDKVWEIRTDR